MKHTRSSHQLDLAYEEKVPSFVKSVLTKQRLGITQIKALLAQLPENADYGDIYKVLHDNTGLQRYVNDESLQNIPKQGPLVIVANHPYSMLDSICLGATIESQRVSGEVKTVGDALTRLLPEVSHKTIMTPELSKLQSGELARAEIAQQTIEYKKQVRAVLENDGVVIYHMAGQTNFRNPLTGVIGESLWKPGALKLARGSNAPIMLAYIDARTGPYYNLLRYMLPRQLVNPLNIYQALRGPEVKITIGETLSPDGENPPNDFRDKVYSLGNQSFVDTKPLLEPLIQWLSR